MLIDLQLKLYRPPIGSVADNAAGRNVSKHAIILDVAFSILLSSFKLWVIFSTYCFCVELLVAFVAFVASCDEEKNVLTCSYQKN